MQDCKLHSYRMRQEVLRRYSAAMQEEQKVIVTWMQRVMDEKGWNAETWAAEAGIAPTSITRAMKPDYRFVSKRQTVQALAAAAGVAPPDLPGLAGVQTVNVENLESLLSVLLPLAPKGRLRDQSRRALAEALAYGLELLGDHLSKPASADVLRMVGRGVASRFRDLGSQ